MAELNSWVVTKVKKQVATQIMNRPRYTAQQSELWRTRGTNVFIYGVMPRGRYSANAGARKDLP